MWFEPFIQTERGAFVTTSSSLPSFPSTLSWSKDESAQKVKYKLTRSKPRGDTASPPGALTVSTSSRPPSPFSVAHMLTLVCSAAWAKPPLTALAARAASSSLRS